MSTKNELEEINRAFSKAVAAGDLDALVGFHTRDACVLPPNASPVRGLAEIREFTQRGLDAGAQTLEFETREILESGDLVIDVGAYVKAYADTPSSDEGKYVAIYERQPSGELKLAVDMFSSNRA